MFACIHNIYTGDVGCIFSPNIVILNISRVIQAIGGGMSTIVSTTVARDVFDAKERLQILGVLGSIRPGAIAGAPMIGGIISNYFGGWRSVYIFTGSVATFVFFLSLFKLPETKDLFFDTQNIIPTTERNIGKIKGKKKSKKERSISEYTPLVSIMNQSSALNLATTPITPDLLHNAAKQATINTNYNYNTAPTKFAFKLDENAEDDEISTDSDFDRSETQTIATTGELEGNELDYGTCTTENCKINITISNTERLQQCKKSKKKIVVDAKTPKKSIAIKQNDTETSNSNVCFVFWLGWKFACSDNIFVLVCAINFFRFAGVATFLNEYPFISEEFFGFNSSMTGIAIGVGASCLIIGSIIAMKLGNMSDRFESTESIIDEADEATNQSNFNTNYSLSKVCSNISELSILRVGCCIGLISSILFTFLPIIFPNTFDISAKNAKVLISGNDCEYGFHWNRIETIWDCYISSMDRSVWYMTLIPFCFYTCSAGMINPPATVILLEPYPDMAGIMAGISTVVTYAFSYSFVIVLTQLLNDKLSQQPFVLHLVCTVCGIMLFIISCFFISKKQMSFRMEDSKI